MKDRTKASVNDVHQYLIHRYNVELCALEMRTHQVRQKRMETKLLRYFNSTPIRNAFARWMTYATYTNRTYTISELVNEIGSNRQTISDIVKDCEAEGWIIADRTDNRCDCKASPILVEKYEDYCDHRRTLVNKVSGVAFSDLRNFERTMSIGFALKEHHNANSTDIDNVIKIVK
jgi:DNA-binding MarR family transcriptional regulator